MASVRIIHAVTDGKSGRRPRSNRRRVEKPLPKVARKDETPKRQTPRKHPKRKSSTPVASKPETPVKPVSLISQTTPALQPVERYTSDTLESWDPEMAEAILLAVAAYNELRKADPELTPVGTI